MPPLPQPNWELAAMTRAGGESLKHSYEAGKFKYNPNAANKFFKRFTFN